MKSCLAVFVHRCPVPSSNGFSLCSNVSIVLLGQVLQQQPIWPARAFNGCKIQVTSEPEPQFCSACLLTAPTHYKSFVPKEKYESVFSCNGENQDLFKNVRFRSTCLNPVHHPSKASSFSIQNQSYVFKL